MPILVTFKHEHLSNHTGSSFKVQIHGICLRLLQCKSPGMVGLEAPQMNLLKPLGFKELKS